MTRGSEKISGKIWLALGGSRASSHFHSVLISVFLMSVFFALLGCKQKEDFSALCEVGTDAKSSEKVIFDLTKRMVSTADTISTLEPVYTGDYIGFTKPLPLMVPSAKSMAAGLPVSWVQDGYKFVAVSGQMENPTWIMVEAVLMEDQTPLQGTNLKQSTLLYSLKSGVIAVRTLTEFQGEKFTTELQRCSANPLLITDLAS